MHNGFLSNYSAHILEYGLAIGYLLLFIPFWRYIQGGKAAEKAAQRRVPAGATALRVVGGWFQVPQDVYVHPGHAWARLERDGAVTVGLDDFAQKLVGRMNKVELPATGSSVEQGAAAIRLGADSKSVAMLAPVDGTVVAVNRLAAEEPERLADAYGDGWLYRVRPSRLDANLKQLLSGAAARKWLETTGESIAARLSPEVGHVLQDGGVPVHGIAQEMDAEHWDEIARKYFLSEVGGTP